MGKKKVKKWTECEVCWSTMKSDYVCLSCVRERFQEDAISTADAWIDGFADPKLAVAIDRNKLVDEIQQAFTDAEQWMIEAARKIGYMSKEKKVKA